MNIGLLGLIATCPHCLSCMYDTKSLPFPRSLHTHTFTPHTIIIHTFRKSNQPQDNQIFTLELHNDGNAIALKAFNGSYVGIGIKKKGKLRSHIGIQKNTVRECRDDIFHNICLCSLPIIVVFFFTRLRAMFSLSINN